MRLPKTLGAWRSNGGISLGRRLHGIIKQFYSSMVKVKPGAKVITIESCANALSVEGVVKLSTIGFEPNGDYELVWRGKP